MCVDDLKIMECAVAMHQFLGYQVGVAASPVDEQTKLL